MNDLSRRRAAKLLGGALLSGLPLAGPAMAQAGGSVPGDRGKGRGLTPKPQTADGPDQDDGAQGADDYTPPDGLTAEDETFLLELQQRGILYFIEQTDPRTGQVLDRASNRGGGERDERAVASIAATGFGLTALCIAHREGLYPSDQIQQRVRATLDFHLNHYS